MKQILLLVVILSVLSAESYAQKNFIREICHYNVSSLWRADSIRVEDDHNDEFPEPLGFIGDHFQRFYIHFISVVKDSRDRLLYHVVGKTRVKNTNRGFQGTMKIISARINPPDAGAIVDDTVGRYRQGYLRARCNFIEDSARLGSGMIAGTMESDFYIDSSNHIMYDALSVWDDGFCNNQFQGVWASYRTGKKKKCNWGDYRIPESGDLDLGAGEFSPSDKYWDKGWQTYSEADFGVDENDPKVLKARAAEEFEWWK